MDKTTLLAELKKQRLVAVIRGKDEDEVTNIVDAVYRGGIHFMEITYTIPQAEQVIAHLCKAYEHCDDIIIGAGICTHGNFCGRAVCGLSASGYRGHEAVQQLSCALFSWGCQCKGYAGMSALWGGCDQAVPG